MDRGTGRDAKWEFQNCAQSSNGYSSFAKTGNGLYEKCLDQLLVSPRYLTCILDSCLIPSSVHKDLLAHAALSSSSLGGEAVRVLVSRWPRERLSLGDLCPERRLRGLVSDGPFLQQLMAGLLNLAPGCPLRTLDCCDLSIPRMFQLPVLYMPREERFSPEVMNNITDQCRTFAEEGEFVLKWKLLELSRSPLTGRYQGNVPLEIRVHLKLSLTEWLAMADEVIGLCTQARSPYVFSVTNLSVDNYHSQGSAPFKWLLSTIDKQGLSQLNIYGKARSMRVLMLELHEYLSHFCALETFALGDTGPRLGSRLVGPDEPTDEAVHAMSATVLRSWHKLQVLQIMGLVLTGHLYTWLDALRFPLEKISLYACKLTEGDLDSLAASHHLTGLKQLALERNDLRGCSRVICELIQNSPHLELLNLRETSMEFDEKSRIVCSLCSHTTIHTLVLYEEEAMLSTSGYQEIVTLACAVKSLKSFFIFPFNYRPFEVLYRKSIDDLCSEIKRINHRLNLKLYY